MAITAFELAVEQVAKMIDAFVFGWLLSVTNSQLMMNGPN